MPMVYDPTSEVIQAYGELEQKLIEFINIVYGPNHVESLEWIIAYNGTDTDSSNVNGFIPRLSQSWTTSAGLVRVAKMHLNLIFNKHSDTGVE